MKPTWQPIRLACKTCRHEWDDWQPGMVPIATWAAHVRTYHCPNCGAGACDVLSRRSPRPRPLKSRSAAGGVDGPTNVR